RARPVASRSRRSRSRTTALTRGLAVLVSSGPVMTRASGAHRPAHPADRCPEMELDAAPGVEGQGLDREVTRPERALEPGRDPPALHVAAVGREEHERAAPRLQER